MDNHELYLRRAIIQRLKNDQQVAEIVGERVHEEPPAKPTWPYLLYGLAFGTPFRADGWLGASIAVTIHCFAQGPGTDQVTALKTAVRNALGGDDDDGSDIPMEGAGGVVTLQFAGDQTLRDTPEASAYHGVVEFEAATAEVV